MFRQTLTRAADIAEQASLWLAGLMSAYLLFVVAFNVVARTVFDATDAALNLMIPAAIEQATYALLILVMAALAVSVRTGMIAVDLFVHRMPRLVRMLAARLWFVLMLALALTLAWAFGGETLTLAGRGDVTQDLGLPLWMFYAVITVECLVLALICLAEALTATEIGEGAMT